MIGNNKPAKVSLGRGEESGVVGYNQLKQITPFGRSAQLTLPVQGVMRFLIQLKAIQLTYHKWYIY